MLISNTLYVFYLLIIKNDLDDSDILVLGPFYENMLLLIQP